MVVRPPRPSPNLEEYYRRKLTPSDIDRVRHQACSRGIAMHDALMNCRGWPSVAPAGCTQPIEDDPVRTNVAFSAGAGGLHSTEN